MSLGFTTFHLKGNGYVIFILEEKNSIFLTRKKCWTIPSVGKVMLMLFFCRECFVHSELMLKGATISGASSYYETIKWLRLTLKIWQPVKLLKTMYDCMQGQKKHANFWKSLVGKCEVTILIAQTNHCLTSMCLVP